MLQEQSILRVMCARTKQAENVLAPQGAVLLIGVVLRAGHQVLMMVMMWGPRGIRHTQYINVHRRGPLAVVPTQNVLDNFQHNQHVTPQFPKEEHHAISLLNLAGALLDI